MHFMNGIRYLFLAQHFIKPGGFAFTHVLGHILHAATENPFTELNFNDITQLQIISGLYDLAVYQNVAFGASVVGNGAAFDNAGYF